MAAISSAEAAVYDRQIRLWGLDAQKRFGFEGYSSGLRPFFCSRFRNSSVLLVGSRSLAAEVGKNVVLSGVRRLSRERTFLDSKNPGNEGKEVREKKKNRTKYIFISCIFSIILRFVKII